MEPNIKITASTTKIFIFKLMMNGKESGTYGAFDETELSAKARLEEFFRGMGPEYHVEAICTDWMLTEAAEKSGLQVSVPVLSRRTVAR